MKFIDRNSVSAPGSLDLTDPNSNASKELHALRAHVRGPRDKKFEFRAYKEGDDVAKALVLLFKGICAYCESDFKSTSPGDVEHYRPKSKVKENDTHPGYWWIAADWQNLLMSCIDCNRGRYHHFYDVAKAECVLVEKKEKQGKDCSFPIRGPGYVTFEGEDLEQEDPLLIDPTKRDPAEHLRWKIKDDFPLLAPITCSDDLDPHGRGACKPNCVTAHDTLTFSKRITSWIHKWTKQNSKL